MKNGYVKYTLLVLWLVLMVPAMLLVAPAAFLTWAGKKIGLAPL